MFGLDQLNTTGVDSSAHSLLPPAGRSRQPDAAARGGRVRPARP